MGNKWTPADMPSLAGKRALVTGANSGLGLYTTQGLAAAGASVIMACRNPAKAEAALATVKAAVPAADVELMTLDLADLASVRAFAEAVAAAHPVVDLLVNNAGVMAVPFQKTKDGFEMQIGTNHFGHFALTGLLLPQLQAAPAARVVSVASMAHRWTRRMNLDDPNFQNSRYNKWDAYGKSKLANLLFMFELNRKLQAAGAPITSVAAHPGYSDTNLQYVGPAQEKSTLGRWLMKAGNRMLAQPAAHGAWPSLYAASMPDVQGGQYYGPDGFREFGGHPTTVGCRKLARNPEVAAGLWQVSEELTGVRYP